MSKDIKHTRTWLFVRINKLRKNGFTNLTRQDLINIAESINYDTTISDTDLYNKVKEYSHRWVNHCIYCGAQK